MLMQTDLLRGGTTCQPRLLNYLYILILDVPVVVFLRGGTFYLR